MTSEMKRILEAWDKAPPEETPAAALPERPEMVVIDDQFDAMMEYNRRGVQWAQEQWGDSRYAKDARERAGYGGKMYENMAQQMMGYGAMGAMDVSDDMLRVLKSMWGDTDRVYRPSRIPTMQISAQSTQAPNAGLEAPPDPVRSIDHLREKEQKRKRKSRKK